MRCTTYNGQVGIDHWRQIYTYTMLDLESEIANKNQIGSISHTADNHRNHLVSINSSFDEIPKLSGKTNHHRMDMPRSLDIYSNNHSMNISIEGQPKKDGDRPNENKHEKNIIHHKSYFPLVPATSNTNYHFTPNEEEKQSNYQNRTDEMDLEHNLLESYMSETPEDIAKLKTSMMEGGISYSKDSNESVADLLQSPMYIITEEDYMKHKRLLRKNKGEEETNSPMHENELTSGQHESVIEGTPIDKHTKKSELLEQMPKISKPITSIVAYNYSHSELSDVVVTDVPIISSRMDDDGLTNSWS